MGAVGVFQDVFSLAEDATSRHVTHATTDYRMALSGTHTNVYIQMFTMCAMYVTIL